MSLFLFTVYIYIYQLRAVVPTPTAARRVDVVKTARQDFTRVPWRLM